MLAEITTKNQLTIPKNIINELGPRIFRGPNLQWTNLTSPVRIQRADAVRAKLAELDITEQDVTDSVAWVPPTLTKTRPMTIFQSPARRPPPTHFSPGHPTTGR
jgi:hypothetical protein